MVIQQGRERYCEARPEKLGEVSSWIEQYHQLWEHRFDRLDEVLMDLQKKENKNVHKK